MYVTQKMLLALIDRKLIEFESATALRELIKAGRLLEEIHALQRVVRMLFKEVELLNTPMGLPTYIRPPKH